MHEPDHQDYLAPFAPSVFAKSQPIRKTVGRGGGDRTRSPIEFGNDLLLASRNSDVASALLENDLALSSSIRRPLPLDESASACAATKSIVWDVGYKPTSPGISMTLRPLLINSTATKQQTGSRTGNSQRRVAAPPEVGHTSQHKGVSRY